MASDLNCADRVVCRCALGQALPLLSLLEAHEIEELI